MTNSVDLFSECFSARPDTERKRLETLRALVHRVAASIPEVTELEECLKWGQPSFVAKPKGVGSTVRIDGGEGHVSVYFICTTGLVERFREVYPDTFTFVGNREIRFAPGDEFPEAELAHCIAMALTYHRDKKRA